MRILVTKSISAILASCNFDNDYVVTLTKSNGTCLLSVESVVADATYLDELLGHLKLPPLKDGDVLPTGYPPEAYSVMSEEFGIYPSIGGCGIIALGTAKMITLPHDGELELDNFSGTISVSDGVASITQDDPPSEMTVVGKLNDKPFTYTVDVYRDEDCSYGISMNEDGTFYICDVHDDVLEVAQFDPERFTLEEGRAIMTSKFVAKLDLNLLR